MAKYKIKVRKDWCKSCGICVDFCPKRVLGFDKDRKAIVEEVENCIGCMMCEYRCPDFAIRVEGCENNEAES